MAKKQSIKTVIAVILVLVMLITVIQAVVKIKKGRAKKAKPKAAQEQVTVITPSDLSIKTEAKQEKQQAWGQDPFTGRAIRSGFGKAAAFQLSGIIHNQLNPQDSYAIIDNSVVRVGDVLIDSDMKVVEIREREVILSDDSKEMRLKLW